MTGHISDVHVNFIEELSDLLDTSEFMNMYCMSGIIRKIFLDIREQLPRIISSVWLSKKKKKSLAVSVLATILP